LAFALAPADFDRCPKRQHWVLPSVQESAMQSASQSEIMRDVTPIIPWLELCFVATMATVKTECAWATVRRIATLSPIGTILIETKFGINYENHKKYYSRSRCLLSHLGWWSTGIHNLS